ncbi:Bax inhibitor 1, partial [Branchiostoma belcheri]
VAGHHGEKAATHADFLLIILKEPNMPESGCSCESSSRCKCRNLGLTSIPQNLPTSISELDLEKMPESAPSSPQLTTSTRIPDIQLISHNSHYHWYFKFNAAQMSDPADKTRATLASPLAITLEKPESAPNSPLLLPIGSSCGLVAGTILIGTFLAVIWYKKRTRHPPLGLNPNVVGGNTNTSASVMTSGDDHQYNEIDKPRVKTGQGQSQANTASNTNTIANVLASGHDQTGQGQSQTVTESLDVRNLCYDTGQTASQQNSVYKAVTQSQTITNTAVVMTSGDVQTGQGQYQAITESLDARNLSYGTGPTASQQNSVYKAVTQSQTITNTAVVMTSGDVQTGQGQYQAITESLDARNLSYGTGPTASQQNSVYKAVTQSQTITNTATVTTSGHDHTGRGQDQSQTNTESKTNTTATVVASGHDKAGQGQS